MTRLILPRRLASTQPGQGAALARHSPLARGLVFAATGAPGTGCMDFVSGKLPAVAGASSTILAGEGAAVQPPASNGSINWGFTGLDALSGPGTLLLRMRSNSNGASYRVFKSHEPNTTGDGVYLVYDDVSYVLNGFLLGGNNNNNRLASSNNALGSNAEQSFHTFGASWDGSTITTWADGKLDRSGASTFLPNANSGRSTALASGSAASEFIFAYAWARVLSAAEIADITSNPWQIFIAPARPILTGLASPPSLSGSLSASDSPDSASLSGSYGPAGSLNASDPADSLSASGSHGPAGTLSAADPIDSASLTGSYGPAGSLSCSDNPDSASLSGIIPGAVLTLSHRRILAIPAQPRALAIPAQSRILTQD